MQAVNKSLDDFIFEDEGEKLRPYWDTEGWLTIGVGHNLGVYVPDPEIRKQIALPKTDIITIDVSRMILHIDVQYAEREIINLFPDHVDWPIPRYYALVGMMFNLGVIRFKGFKKMIGALLVGDFKEAARQILDSDAGRKLKNRYESYASMVRGF